VRRSYTIAPYGYRVAFTDCVKTFNALSSTSGLGKLEASGAMAPARTGGYVVGVFDRHWLTAVHECTHLAATVLPAVGIDPLSNNSEPLAYLVDNLTAVCCKLLGIR
jgi:hypothetical protein